MISKEFKSILGGSFSFLDENYNQDELEMTQKLSNNEWTLLFVFGKNRASGDEIHQIWSYLSHIIPITTETALQHENDHFVALILARPLMLGEDRLLKGFLNNKKNSAKKLGRYAKRFIKWS